MILPQFRAVTYGCSVLRPVEEFVPWNARKTFYQFEKLSEVIDDEVVNSKLYCNGILLPRTASFAAWQRMFFIYNHKMCDMYKKASTSHVNKVQTNELLYLVIEEAV